MKISTMYMYIHMIVCYSYVHSLTKTMVQSYQQLTNNIVIAWLCILYTYVVLWLVVHY